MINRAWLLISAFLFSFVFPGSSAAQSTFNHHQQLLRLTRFSGPIPTFGFGASAAFDNPALLSGVYGQHLSFSAQDLTNPLSFSGAYNGRLQERTTFGIAHAFASRGKYLENISVISFSSSGAGPDFGVNLKTMFGNRLQHLYASADTATYESLLFSMDFDVGMLFRFLKNYYGGLTIFNVAGANIVENADFEIFPERAAKLQIGWTSGKKWSTTVFSEAQVDSFHDFSFSQFSSGGGVEQSLMEKDRILIRAGYHFLSKRKKAVGFSSLMASAGFSLPVGNHLLKFEYAGRFALSDTLGTFQPSVRHFLQVGYNIGGREDYTPPTISISVDTRVLDRTDDDPHINFLISAHDDQDGRGIKKWALSIYKGKPDKKLEVIKSFYGAGLPPRAIAWDGRDSKKDLLPKGAYYYQLRVVDRAHNFVDSKIKYLAID